MASGAETTNDVATRRLAAIDIGSNSIRLVVAEALPGGEYRVLDDEKETARLGRGVAERGRLDDAAVDRSLAALRRMKQIADGFQVQRLRAIATSAIREADNGEAFRQRAATEVGLEIEVVSSEKEARLAYLSAQRAFSLTGQKVAIVDLGGGSTEIVLAAGEAVEEIYSLKLGAVRMSRGLNAEPPLNGDEFDELLAAIDKRLKKRLGRPPFTPHVMIGSGGTFTALGDMVRQAKGQADLPLRGYSVTRAEVWRLVDRLRKLPLKARRGVPGLSPDRADIIVAGLAIIDRVMRRLGVNRLQVHTGGVRDGLLLTMLEEEAPAATVSTADRRRAVERFAAACGSEGAHNRHAADLAGRLFDQLVQRYKLRSEDRPLLEAAALLQDVGYLIDYDQHHKHSYHLIRHARLAGFTAAELEIVANVARYHRGAEPKSRHKNFRRLAKSDRRRVRLLAAILRLADGLDRGHSQQVCDARLSFDRRGAKLRVLADERPEVEIWGALSRAGLFERVFDTTLTVEWRPSTTAASSAARRSAAGGGHHVAAPRGAHHQHPGDEAPHGHAAAARHPARRNASGK